MRFHSLASAAICGAVVLPAVVHAQLRPITNGDVPGAAAFTPGARVLFEEDWSRAEGGRLPSSIAVVEGSVAVVEERGRRFLKATSPASIDLLLPGALPAQYTIEFDVLEPQGTGYPVEIRPVLPGEAAGYAGVSRRMKNPVAYCGAIASGVYGAPLDSTRRFPNTLAQALAPCEIVVSPEHVAVYFGGEPAADVPNVTLGRTSRVRIHVPATEREPALIGSVRITTNDGAATASIAAGAGSSPAPSNANPPVTRGAPVTGGAAVGAASIERSRPTPPPGVSGATASPPPSSPTHAATAPGSTVSGAGASGPGGLTETRSPKVVAREMLQLQRSASQAAVAILKEFANTTVDQMATALIAGGYLPPVVAKYLRDDAKASVEQAVSVLKNTGLLVPSDVIEAVVVGYLQTGTVSVKEEMIRRIAVAAQTQLQMSAVAYVQALQKSQSIAATKWVQILIAAGYNAQDVAEALRATLQLGDAAAAQAMVDANVAADQVLLGLAGSFNTSAGRGVELLLATKKLTQNAAAHAVATVFKLQPVNLLRALRDGKLSIEDALRAVNHEVPMTPPQIIGMLRGESYQDSQIVQLLKKVIGVETKSIVRAFVNLKTSGFDIMKALHDGLQMTATDATALLRGEGVADGMIATALKSEYKLGEAAVAKTLIGAQADATTVAQSLVAAFPQVTPATVASALQAAGVGPGPIATALMAAFQMGADAVASLLAQLGIK